MSEQIPVLTEAWQRAGRVGTPSVVPFGVVPTAGKLRHYSELGCDEVVLRVPMGDEASVRSVLDDHARTVGLCPVALVGDEPGRRIGVAGVLTGGGR